MKWYSNLSKKARTALLAAAWVLAIAVIVVVASIANGETLPWWAALVMFVAVIPAIILTAFEVRLHAPKTARQGETQASTASASAEGKRPLEGLSFCLAGEYNWANKDIYSLIRDCGGTVETQPHKYLNFMLDDDGEDSLNNKTLTALRLQRNGSRVQIVSLCSLFLYLSNYLDVDGWFSARGYFGTFAEGYHPADLKRCEREAKRFPQLIAKAEKIKGGTSE